MVYYEERVIMAIMTRGSGHFVLKLGLQEHSSRETKCQNLLILQSTNFRFVMYKKAKLKGYGRKSLDIVILE